MSDTLITRFRRWFEYEEDAHAKVLASLDTIPSDRRDGPEYRKAVSLFAHIVMGRRIWLGRLRDLKTWMLEDFGRWYERELPPSTARDLLSRCGYSRMNVFVASAFWHLWAHDYWYPDGGFQALKRFAAEARPPG